MVFFFSVRLGANEAESNGAYSIIMRAYVCTPVFLSRLPTSAVLLNDKNISRAGNQWFGAKLIRRA